METIEIDFEVWKALTARRTSANISYNDVLRKVLGLPSIVEGNHRPAQQNMVASGDWICKGVRFPLGTEFRGHYKGQSHLGKVENASLIVNGKKYRGPSPAAVAITKYPVNGWRFWKCRFPGRSDWQLIDALRK